MLIYPKRGSFLHADLQSKGTNEAILDNEKFGAKSSSDVSLKFSSFKKQIAELRSNDSDEELSHGNTSGL